MAAQKASAVRTTGRGWNSPISSTAWNSGRPERVATSAPACSRSEEHTSELQSRQYLVCRLLLEKNNERLAAAGRAVEQDALGRAQLVLAEQVGVQERQLDGVADLLDLQGQPTDVAVVDVADPLQDELLDLALGDPLVDRSEARRVGTE